MTQDIKVLLVDDTVLYGRPAQLVKRRGPHCSKENSCRSQG